jgi:hypothetical protein
LPRTINLSQAAQQHLILVKQKGANQRCLARDNKGKPMGEIAQFIALPIDLTDHGLVAGEPFKCAGPEAAIERAKGFWKIFGHAGAVALVRTGYPETHTTVLRRFGSVPDILEI